MNLKIIKEFAGQYDIEWELLYAILKQEGRGKDLEGMKIWKRFELGIYKTFYEQKYYGKKNRVLPGLSSKWISLHTDEELMLMSTSWGVAQIMGYWYKELCYDSIEDLVESWKECEDCQLRDFCLFVVKYRNGDFLKAIQRKDFDLVAKMYNGAGYKRNHYAERLKMFYADAKEEIYA